MADVPPLKGVAYEFYTALVSQADTRLLKSTPTLVTGKVKVSKDGGAFANLATLPTVTPAGGVAVRVQLSADEFNANDVVVWFFDPDGEWCEQVICIQTTTVSIAVVAANVAALLGKFTGITLLAKWLQALARSDTADATALGEINSGGGTYSESEHSQEALGDAGSEFATLENQLQIMAKTDLIYPGQSITVVTPMNGTALELFRGDTFDGELPQGLGNFTARTKLWFTLKRSTDATDARAILQITEKDGLLVVNGNPVAIADAGLGALTVTDATAGDMTMQIAAEIMALLRPNTALVYDIQMAVGDEITTLVRGTAAVTADVTRAVE